MNKLFFAVFGLFLGAFAGTAWSEEPAAAADPAAKAKEICAACHGEDGNQSMTPDTPKLGGQPADYLAKALHGYKSGDRKHPVMGAMAAGLSDAEITALARYFSKQKSELFVKY